MDRRTMLIDPSARDAHAPTQIAVLLGISGVTNRPRFALVSDG